MKAGKILGLFGFGGLVAAVMFGTTACPTGTESDAGTDAGTDAGIPVRVWDGGQPTGTTALNFTIDASQRPAGFYTNEELKWKGNFSYDKTSRMLTIGTGWAGPFAGLWDDGSWKSGGHEPEGATASDNKFGITVFAPTPTTDTSFDYGLENNRGWIWQGGNGSATIPAGQTTPVTVPGQTLPPEGTVDMRLMLNTTLLGGAGAFTETPVITVKGNMSDWGEDRAYDDGSHGDATAGDHIFTYTLSANTPTELKVTSGQDVAFVWVFHPTLADGGVGSTEYKYNSGAGLGGVSAATNKAGAGWVAATVLQQTGGDKNTYITIP